MAEDTRSSLRRADTLTRHGRYLEANAIFERVAGEFVALGFALKAVAVAKQVVHICDSHRLVPRKTALRILVDGYAMLGLDAEAEEAGKRLAEVERPN